MKTILVPAGIAKLADVIGGSGDPEAAWEWVGAYLQSLTLPQERRSILGRGFEPTGPEWVSMYLLESLGFTECGTSTRWPWLTGAGEEACAFLATYGSGWRYDARCLFESATGERLSAPPDQLE